MKYVEVIDHFRGWAKEFGAQEGEDCVLRNNTGKEAFTNGGAYFAYVQLEEGPAGAYHDFSLVVFPDEGDATWVVGLSVGSLGFRNDYELAAMPGIRRRYLRLVASTGYIKTSFLDIESSLPRDYIQQVSHIKKTMEMYKKVLPVCEIVNPTTDDGIKKIKGFLALYADIRGWASNSTQRKAIKEAIAEAEVPKDNLSNEEKVKKILESRRFIVLQGASGTGKTRLAKKLAADAGAKVFFTQFHGETTFADFVWGIRPALSEENLKYIPHEGTLVEAIKYALSNGDNKVYLIIDEINRANLANVLGPVFYLFEYHMDESNIDVSITDDLKIKQLPKNLYVIATMNTADRSLAVVDFALRRRFAWYTMLPAEIKDDLVDKTFYKKDFDEIDAIFEQYATDQELNLKPGQGYFIAKDDAEMENRIRYELMPLIKEYLTEGMLSMGKDAFAGYFYDRIHEVIYQ